MEVHTHLDGETTPVEGAVMLNGQTLHPKLAEANNILWIADGHGVSVYIAQAPEFAENHADDTILIAVRGEAVAKARDALSAVVDLVR